MSTDIDWAAVTELKETDEYLALGVLGRERLLYERFPEVEARHRALTARHVERAVWGIDPPATPDPDQEESP